MKILYPILFIGCLLCTENNVLAQTSLLPVIRSVSIDPGTGKVRLEWRAPNPSTDVAFHDISRRPYPNSSGYAILDPPTDTVNMPRLFYEEIVANIGEQAQSYRVRAQRPPEAPSSSEDIHIPVTKFNGEYNVCSNELNLRWQPYRRYVIDNVNGSIIDERQSEAFNNAIEYEVWGYADELPTDFDGAKASRLTERSTSNFDVTVKVTDAQENKVYHLFVKTILPTDEVSTSFLLNIPTANRLLPDFMRIDTVLSSGGDIRLHIDVATNTQNLSPSMRVDTFALYRSDVKYRPIEWFYSVNSIPKVYTDSRGLSLGQVYTYNLVAFRCGKQVMQSDTVSNVQLYVQPSGRNARTRWTEFINQYPENTHYTLTRTAPLPAVTIPGVNQVTDLTEYLDESTVDSLCTGPKNFCYQLKASNGISTAISEVTCVSLLPIISMPNAIDPSRSDIVSDHDCSCCDGGTSSHARNMFGPVLDMDPGSYKATLEIFNRSGLRIFSATKEYDSPMPVYWNGTHNHKQVQEGVYVYGLKLDFKSGFPSQMQRGTVTVVYQAK